MSIATRIESIEEHIGDAYQGLQNIGADITGVNKNIENISAMLEDAYKEAPKVSDTDTDITLDSTRKGRVDMGFSGNTSQFTTTGKNLYPTDFLPVTEYGITISKNANGDIVLNGTPNYNEGYKTFYTGDVKTVEAGTYTLSVANKVAGIGCVVGGFNGGCNLTLSDTVTSKTAYADTPQNVNPAINIRYDVGTLTNFVLNPQMEKSSSATTYEPFTNGASPNPDYPQDIHVVSGDNKITVYGKNMFDDSIVTNLWSEYSTNKIVSANGANLHKFNCKQGDTFTLKATYDSASSNSVILIQFFDSNDNSLGRYASANDTTLTLTKTAPANTSYAYMGRYLNTPTTIQLEKNNQATNYEPYKEGTYPINLGVKNLWDVNNLQSGFLPQSGSYPTTNTSYPNARYTLITLKKDKSITLSGITFAGSGRVRYIDIDTNEVVGNMTYLDSAYYTATHTFGDGFYEGTITAKKDFIVGIMDLNGEINNLIVNYGTTPQTISPNPIELAEISTYNDEIFRTSGKNLCNGINQGVYLNNDVNRCGVTSGDSGLYIPVNGGQYTISTLVKQTRYRVACSNDLPPSVGSAIAYNGQNKDNTSNSITINTTGYNYLIVNATDLSAIQIEKGSSATEYNPFGTGEWYYKEGIKKKVLDGTERIGSTSGYLAAGRFDFLDYYDGLKGSTNNPNCKSNYYISKFAQENGCIFLSGVDAHINIVDTTYINNLEGFKTWLGNVKPQVKYILATPTYTKITSSNYPTLYSQLEAIYNAQGYDNQTNISQTNNDLPFKITASALEG